MRVCLELPKIGAAFWRCPLNKECSIKSVNGIPLSMPTSIRGLHCSIGYRSLVNCEGTRVHLVATPKVVDKDRDVATLNPKP